MRSTLARAGRSGLGFALTLAIVTTVVACSGGGTDGASTGQVAVPVVTLPAGAQVYADSCAKCHGANREGRADKGPAPALDAVRVSSMGDQRLRLTIGNGTGQMRGFPGLTPDQVDRLVAFLKAA